jgi:hypothetical protein
LNNLAHLSDRFDEEVAHEVNDRIIANAIASFDRLSEFFYQSRHNARTWAMPTRSRNLFLFLLSEKNPLRKPSLWATEPACLRTSDGSAGGHIGGNAARVTGLFALFFEIRFAIIAQTITCILSPIVDERSRLVRVIDTLDTWWLCSLSTLSQTWHRQTPQGQK